MAQRPGAWNQQAVAVAVAVAVAAPPAPSLAPPVVPWVQAPWLLLTLRRRQPSQWRRRWRGEHQGRRQPKTLAAHHTYSRASSDRGAHVSSHSRSQRARLRTATGVTLKAAAVREVAYVTVAAAWHAPPWHHSPPGRSMHRHCCRLGQPAPDLPHLRRTQPARARRRGRQMVTPASQTRQRRQSPVRLSAWVARWAVAEPLISPLRLLARSVGRSAEARPPQPPWPIRLRLESEAPRATPRGCPQSSRLTPWRPPPLAPSPSPSRRPPRVDCRTRLSHWRQSARRREGRSALHWPAFGCAPRQTSPHDGTTRGEMRRGETSCLVGSQSCPGPRRPS